jgi:hypothetical protein
MFQQMMEPINYAPSRGGFPRSFIGAWVNISQIDFIIKLNIFFNYVIICSAKVQILHAHIHS